LDLLAEGKVDLPLSDVAERSGVSRTTIYRWWPTQAELLREALTYHTRRLDVPDTGSWAGDVYAFVAQMAAFLSDPIERAQNAILASGLHPDFHDAAFEYWLEIVEHWFGVVQRGIERGEVAPDTDPANVIYALVSPLLVITLLEQRLPSPEDVMGIGKLVIRATEPREATRSGKAAEARTTSSPKKGRAPRR
jgi:AcrR family transcriptional regulator